MRHRRLGPGIAGVVAWIALVGAGPTVPSPSFPAPALERTSKGIVIVSQSTGGQLIAADIVVPAGLAQQSPGNAGVAGVTAALVLRTKVDGGASLADAAARVGATVSYTLDQNDTRFYLEAQPGQFGTLLHGLVDALSAPATTELSTVRAAAIAAAQADAASPAVAALGMLRQIAYDGTGYAYPDSGRQLSLNKLSAADVAAFASSYRQGQGTIVALEGAVDESVVAKVRTEFANFASASSASNSSPLQPPSTRGAGSHGSPIQNSVARGNEVVTHRAVSAPWVAVGYPAPNMYGADFPAMLVIEALLGRGGDVHSFALGSDSSLPDEFVGAYYQYEAQPGMLAIFLNGSDANVDASVRDLQSAVNRLRGAVLPDAIVDHGRRLAIGQYFTGVSTLGDAAWMLGRSAASTDGPNFENLLPLRIAQVSSADVRRVAQRYLTGESIGIVLPQTPTQR